MAYIDFEKISRKNDHHMYNLHSHSHYEIYFLLEGNRLLYFNESMYEFDAPTIIVIPPYFAHKTEGGPYTRINISVSPAYLNKFQLETLQRVSLQPFIPNKENSSEITKILEWLNDAYTNHESEDVINALFSYLVYLLSRIHKDEGNPTIKVSKKTPPHILKVIAYINEHYSEKITLESISEKFNISKFTLNYGFKKALSCTPIDYLLFTRISKAEQMLMETNKTINEISDACGFSSSNYFGMIFKKKKKVSPATFRKTRR